MRWNFIFFAFFFASLSFAVFFLSMLSERFAEALLKLFFASEGFFMSKLALLRSVLNFTFSSSYSRSAYRISEYPSLSTKRMKFRYILKNNKKHPQAIKTVCGCFVRENYLFSSSAATGATATNLTIAISAPSPRRGPIFNT